ncbi:hypothetical protein [Staphylococcus aureus]|uniref:hypothetical protein n=1 Tax=Staphylococcus aureus TaxID=1280 RepID=UPI0013A68D09|nr:hypothetical protein [Staphylococcus aureus]
MSRGLGDVYQRQIKMYFAQLDGEITNKQSQELLDKEYKKAIELENKNKEQKLEK